jgi:uncharacterized protein (DUF885 family)
MSSGMTRTPTVVDEIADRYLDAAAALDPSMATYWGLAGHDDRMPDLDPAWYQARSDLRRSTLADLAAAEPSDDRDRITVAALREDLEAAEGVRDLGAEESDLKNIDSPVQTIRDTFDLTPTADVDDWAVIAARLAAVDRAVSGYVESLRYAADRGIVRARRQVRAAIEQCARNAGPDGFFATYARTAAADDGAVLPDALRADLERGAASAGAAYERLAAHLREDLLPRAQDRDAFGRDQYAAFSRLFVGSRVDLEDAYAWGQDELARVTAEMQRTAVRIRPGASVADAMALLEADPARKLHGTDALQEWMQGKSDAAVAALAGTHFDIPEPIRRLECRIAPTQDGGVYYTGPSEDLVTRPGRMWWSVPEGDTEFGTWRELSTVYHEGVPGHHLQIAQTAYRKEILNRWLRVAAWVSGHGEGWALYAERLMADLGFLDDPADYLGMLDGQSLRAARVVLDIGFHCGFPAPSELGGGEWTYEKAWTFLGTHSAMSEGVRRFELERYLGWPGQAPSYKLGERMWLQLRDDVRAAEGDAFDLAAFHRRALDVGSVGMDVLRGAVLGTL